MHGPAFMPIKQDIGRDDAMTDVVANGGPGSAAIRVLAQQTVDVAESMAIGQSDARTGYAGEIFENVDFVGFGAR